MAQTTTATVQLRLCQRQLGLRTKRTVVQWSKVLFSFGNRGPGAGYTEPKLPEIHCNVSTGTSQKTGNNMEKVFFYFFVTIFKK